MIPLSNYYSTLKFKIMNEELEKKEWVKPEIVDLDVKNTESGSTSWLNESGFYHPPIS